jgi:hypothetical protein
MANSDEGDSGMKDGFKVTIIISLLLAVLGLMLLQTLWPRQTNLSAESMQGITQVAESMKQSAANWEKISKSTTELHEVLLAQAQGSRNEISMLHKQLLGRYGLDANDPYNEYVNSMLEQSDGYGGGNVPRGEGRAGANPTVQETNGQPANKVNRSPAGAPDHSDGTSPKPAK